MNEEQSSGEQPSRELVDALGMQLGLVFPDAESFGELREKISRYINELISKDFDRLIHLLYRIDVSESKLRFLLKEKVGEDAALIIADLIIERQLQKLAAKQQFRQPPPVDLGDELW